METRLLPRNGAALVKALMSRTEKEITLRSRTGTMPEKCGSTACQKIVNMATFKRNMVIVI